MVEQFDNDFNPASISKQGETPTLARAVTDAIDSMLRDLHVALPAQVVKVRNNSFVDVQPMLQRLYKGQAKAVNLPVIQNVPVKNLSGTDWWIKCPVAVDDTGTILVHERSLDKWIVQGGVIDPADPRRHDLSDAEYIPGLRPQNAVLPGAAADMVLHNGSGEIYIQKGGGFKITNGSKELIATLISLAQTLETASTLAGGPFIPSVVSAIGDAVSALQSLEGT